MSQQLFSLFHSNTNTHFTWQSWHLEKYHTPFLNLLFNVTGKNVPSIPRQSLGGDIGELDIINYAQLPAEEDDGSEKGTQAMSVTIRSKKSAGPDDVVDVADVKRESSITSQVGDTVTSLFYVCGFKYSP
jgi:hypothetical protein